MVTIQDIARRASVSSATVSRVLNNKSATIPISSKTREKVMALAKEMGYRPNPFAKSLRTNRTHNVGVVVWDLTDPFFSAILKGIEQVLVESGYNLLLANADCSRDRELECLEKLRGLFVEGLLIVGGIDCFCSKKIDKIGLDPETLMLIGIRTVNTTISSISVDNVRGGFLGAEYLIQQGRQSIAYIAGKDRTSDMDDRLEGVREAVAHHDCAGRVTILEEEPGEAAGYRVAREFLEQAPLPAAIFGLNDPTCVGIIRAAQDMGLAVPDDVAVLGCDDVSFAQYLVPRLSTIKQPRLEMGRAGAKALIERIGRTNGGQPTAPHIEILQPRLVPRETT